MLALLAGLQTVKTKRSASWPSPFWSGRPLGKDLATQWYNVLTHAFLFRLIKMKRRSTCTMRKRQKKKYIKKQKKRSEDTPFSTSLTVKVNDVCGRQASDEERWQAGCENSLHVCRGAEKLNSRLMALRKIVLSSATCLRCKRALRVGFVSLSSTRGKAEQRRSHAQWVSFLDAASSCTRPRALYCFAGHHGAPVRVRTGKQPAGRWQTCHLFVSCNHGNCPPYILKSSLKLA